jgi:hypothetical protein
VAWARLRSREGANSKLGWQLGLCKTLAVYVSSPIHYWQDTGVNLPLKMWGPSIPRLGVERRSRVDQGVERSGAPRGVWEGAVFHPQKILGFFDTEMVHFGGFWVIQIKIRHLVYNITSQTTGEF